MKMRMSRVQPLEDLRFQLINKGIYMITTGDRIDVLKQKLEDPVVSQDVKFQILDFFAKHNRLIWEKIDVEEFVNVVRDRWSSG